MTNLLLGAHDSLSFVSVSLRLLLAKGNYKWTDVFSTNFDRSPTNLTGRFSEAMERFI